MTKTIKAYKGFDKNLCCDPTGNNPFQYEIGKEYEEEKSEIYRSGFHACENPIDVFGYYDPGESRYCEVVIDGDVEKGADGKICDKRIKIVKEIGIDGIVSEFFGELKKFVTNATSGDISHAATSGYSSHAATSGYRSRSITRGNMSHAMSSGDFSRSIVSGRDSIAASLGRGGKAKWGVRQYLTDEDEPTARAAVEQIAEEIGADLMSEVDNTQTGVV